MTYKAAVRLEKRISEEWLVYLASGPLIARIADRLHREGGTEAPRECMLRFLFTSEYSSDAVSTDLGRFEHRLMVAVLLDGFRAAATRAWGVFCNSSERLWCAIGRPYRPLLGRGCAS